MISTCLALLLAGAPPTQGGYSTEKFPEQGLSFPLARDFDQLPLPPDEPWRVLYFAEKQSVVERQGHQLVPVLFVVRIDWQPDPPDLDPEAPPPITTFDRYLAQIYPGYGLSRPKAERSKDGYLGQEFDLIKTTQSPGAAWCYLFQREQPTRRAYALIGYCHAEDYEELTDIWRKSAEGLRLSEPVERDLSSLRREYERRPFRDPERRIGLRARLIRGWESEDTENYLLLVHEPRKPFLRSLSAGLEALRGVFAQTLGPAPSEGAVGIVRLCATQDEYHIYGGAEGYAAVYNEFIEELVLYDPAKSDGDATEQDVLATAWGEAFDQYLHDRVGDLAQPWFAQGHSDYFSGARLSGKRVRVHPSHRLAAVQRLIERKETLPLEDLIRLDADAFAEKRAFRQSGSLVYFLRASEFVARHARWSGILGRYFATLVATRDERLAAGDAAAAARAAAREAALADAFDGVDLPELERAWLAYTRELDLP